MFPELSKGQISKQLCAIADMQALVSALFSSDHETSMEKSESLPNPEAFFDGNPSRRDMAKFWLASMRACIKLLEKEMA